MYMCVCIYIYIYTHTHKSDLHRLYMNYHCYQILLRVKHLYTNLERCEVFLGNLSRSAGLVVTGRIRNIGQNVLQSVVQTGSGSSPSYFQIFSLIAFLEEAFIRNTMIILGINEEKLSRYK